MNNGTRIYKLDEVFSSHVLTQAEHDYKFKEELTTELDAYVGDFTAFHLLKIVLWKLNRYPGDTEVLAEQVNDLRKNYTKEKANAVLRSMMDSKGFNLPMASTVLRFALPDVFQIIDQRVYRLITPGEEHLKLPSDMGDKIELYFDYLSRLKAACERYDIPFNKADRLLYQLDKMVNAAVPIRGY